MVKTEYSDPIASNRLARQFDIHRVALTQACVGNITYIPTHDSLPWLIVSDLASLCCVGWTMRDTMHVDSIAFALRVSRGGQRTT